MIWLAVLLTLAAVLFVGAFFWALVRGGRAAIDGTLGAPTDEKARIDAGAKAKTEAITAQANADRARIANESPDELLDDARDHLFNGVRKK